MSFAPAVVSRTVDGLRFIRGLADRLPPPSQCECDRQAIGVPPFGVTFDRISSFNGRPGHHPLVLTASAGLDELIRLEQRLGDALRGTGLRVSRARFTPHLTLLYDEVRCDRRAIGPITWTVREFVLIHSWLGKTRYEVKGRWPLGDGGPAVSVRR
ncbi:2'-5' RNA ligase family protein [Cupriavidus sp. 30B13]|uniref:2'-5' RNA ligase family protein n=1 Tax=Cupriavidus sp. 30B13 TaxID=3384241 RepID=UPI003B917CC5